MTSYNGPTQPGSDHGEPLGEKDGDKLLRGLKSGAKYRNKCLIITYLFGSPLYQPPWYYWLDYTKCNSN